MSHGHKCKKKSQCFFKSCKKMSMLSHELRCVCVRCTWWSLTKISLGRWMVRCMGKRVCVAVRCFEVTLASGTSPGSWEALQSRSWSTPVQIALEGSHKVKKENIFSSWKQVFFVWMPILLKKPCLFVLFCWEYFTVVEEHSLLVRRKIYKWVSQKQWARWPYKVSKG